MSKPLILVTPQKMPMEAPFAGSYVYTSECNMNAVRLAGGLPLLPEFQEQEEAEALMERADGLLMSGGADVSPQLYGEEPIPECGKTQPRRDRTDRLLMEAALKRRKPILCICRGCQLANVLMGGTLFQDIPRQFPTDIRHSDHETYGQTLAHRVNIVPGTPLEALFGPGSLPVNSLHHQAIRELAPRLKPMAYAPDGIIEAWFLPGREQWMRGYQWHPEKLEDSTQIRKIFGQFLAACRGE